MNRALVVVDVQYDFVEGGALAVSGGTLVAQRIASFIQDHHRDYVEIVFTQDWHKAPPDTNGGHFGDPPDFVDTWPVHCVANSRGANLHEDIVLLADELQTDFRKGYGKPDYSGFQGTSRHGHTLNDYLRMRAVDELHICGLAADYCVRETALDSASLDYVTVVLPELTAAVHPGGIEETMRLVEEIQ